MTTPVPPIVVAGPSGSGKTTLGVALARELQVRFIDGDDLHPASNIAKMSTGQPLQDHDRWPWLATIAEMLGRAAEEERGLVLACSALKWRYRRQISATVPMVAFLMLQAPHDLLAQRLARRSEHFMPATMVQSQLADLEPLRPDERGGCLDSTVELQALLASALHTMRSLNLVGISGDRADASAESESAAPSSVTDSPLA